MYQGCKKHLQCILGCPNVYGILTSEFVQVSEMNCKFNLDCTIIITVTVMINKMK